MIVYFADRQWNILGSASTGLPGGLTVTEDLKSQDTETGVAVFECHIPFDKSTRLQVEAWTQVGNYLLRSSDSENEVYTIIESESDSKAGDIFLYAEDAGMDLLNEVVGPYEADQAYPIDHYMEKYAAGAGFQIGINEVEGMTRKLSWEGESTATERIASVATQFDGCEISFSFDVSGLVVTRKYINIYKKRGKNVSEPLRLNTDIDKIRVKKSIANLATALQCTGGTPDNKDTPITLKGYAYDDGDFYVEDGVLKSREALKKWGRYLWKQGDRVRAGGHITKQYSYDTTSQQTLCAHAVTELKKRCDMEVNYEADIRALPRNVKIGDRVNVVDDGGALYLSTRILMLETSETERRVTVTMGEHLIRDSGIAQQVQDLAEQFAKTSQTAVRSQVSASLAVVSSSSANAAATNAQATANNAQTTANNAQTGAEQASADVQQLTAQVDNLEQQVSNLEAQLQQMQDQLDSLLSAGT